MKEIEILKILIVEDDRKRVELFESWMPDGFRAIFARTAGTALGILERDRRHVYAGVCLDHDLQQCVVVASDRDLSGSTVVRAVAKYISPDVPVLVHSQNLARACYMVDKLTAAGFDVTRIPMDKLECNLFHEWLEEVKEMWQDFHEE
jgi:CheY-like chemotaxis protein